MELHIASGVPNFHLSCSTISRFQDVAHFKNFPIESHVKISKCPKFFKIWTITKKSNRLYSTMVANALIKLAEIR